MHRLSKDFSSVFPRRHFYGFFNRVNRFVFLFPFAFFFLFAWRHLLLDSLVFSMFTFFYSLPLCLRWYFMHLVHTLIELNVHGMVLSLNFVTIFLTHEKNRARQMEKLGKIDPLHFENCAKQKHWKIIILKSKSWQRQKLASPYMLLCMFSNCK